jgi:hypothetical protein
MNAKQLHVPEPFPNASKAFATNRGVYAMSTTGYNDAGRTNGD